jgi:copper chaperone
METITLSIEGMSCGHCVAAVREALAELPGVEVEQVRVGAATVRLDGAHTAESAESVLAAVRDAGYDATVAA